MSVQFASYSSLNITPPLEYWPQFVNIKKNHVNPKIKRPPFPHITLINPVVIHDDIDIAYQRMVNILQDVQPFVLQFSKFEIFQNNTSSTLFLEPEDSEALRNLYLLLAKEFSIEISTFGGKCDFVPHIGIGFFKGKSHFLEATKFRELYQKDWNPIQFLCKEIYIMTHLTPVSPYEVRKVILLGKDSSPPHFGEKPFK